MRTRACLVVAPWHALRARGLQAAPDCRGQLRLLFLGRPRGCCTCLRLAFALLQRPRKLHVGTLHGAPQPQYRVLARLDSKAHWLRRQMEQVACEPAPSCNVVNVGATVHLSWMASNDHLLRCWSRLLSTRLLASRRAWTSVLRLGDVGHRWPPLALERPWRLPYNDGDFTRFGHFDCEWSGDWALVNCSICRWSCNHHIVALICGQHVLQPYHPTAPRCRRV